MPPAERRVQIARSLARLAALAFLLLVPPTATAGNTSATVTVSARVVESCRVEIGTLQASGVEVKARCSPGAKPSLGRSGQTAAETVTLPLSQIAATANGPVLSIDF